MADKTENKVVLGSVIVVREGKRIAPPINKAFPFTAEEVKAINEVNPRAIRDARNEDDEADVAEVIALSNSPGRVPMPGAVSGAGATTAMAAGFDGAPTTNEQSADANKPKPGGKGGKPAADDDL